MAKGRVVGTLRFLYGDGKTTDPPLRFASVGGDNSVLVFGFGNGKFENSEGRAADPSASLGMTKGRAAFPLSPVVSRSNWAP
jgi:hypothetical protein